MCLVQQEASAGRPLPGPCLALALESAQLLLLWDVLALEAQPSDDAASELANRQAAFLNQVGSINQSFTLQLDAVNPYWPCAAICADFHRTKVPVAR